MGSGIQISSLLERLGVAAAIAPKVTRPDTDVVSELVAERKAELGLVIITQILTMKGVTLVGPLPPDIQWYIVFTGGIASTAAAPEAARQLLGFLAGPGALRLMRTQGMEPPR